MSCLHYRFVRLSLPILALSLLVIYQGVMGEDSRLTGTWEQKVTVDASRGVEEWVLVVHPDGSYDFSSTGRHGVFKHSGTFTASDGQWSMVSETIEWRDFGTYQVPESGILVMTGKYGTGVWRRKEGSHLEMGDPAVKTKGSETPVRENDKGRSTPGSSGSHDSSSGDRTAATIVKPPPSQRRPMEEETSASSELNDYLLGLDALERGRWEEAILGFTKALQNEPESADYFTARGVANALAERLEDAQRDLERANRLMPNHKPIKLWLATVVAMQGRFDKDQIIYPSATRDEYENEVRRMSREYGNLLFLQARGDGFGEHVPEARSAYEGAIRSFPTLAKMFVEHAKPAGANISGVIKQRGIERYNAGQFADAMKDLTHARVANPGDLDVIYYHAGCKLALGAPEGARADYTTLLLQRPGWESSLLGRAMAYAAMGDGQKARQDLALALKLNPTIEKGYREKIEHKIEGGERLMVDRERGDLLKDLFESVRRGEEWYELKASATTLIHASQEGRLRSDERYQKRCNELRELTALPGATADDFAALGQFLYSEALIVLGEAVEPGSQHQPFRPQTSESLGQELALAEEMLNKALRLNSRHARALAFKAACRMKRENDWQVADSLLRQAISIDGRDPVILDLFAQVMDYAAFVQAAAAADLRSGESWSDYWYVYYRWPTQAELNQADALDRMASKMWEMARSSLKAAAEAEPGKATSHYYRAVIAEREKNLPVAATELRQAVELDPEYFAAWQRLGVIAGKLGKTNEAYASQSRMVNLVHTSAAPLLKLAWLQLGRTAFQSAESAVNGAAAIDPADPRVAAFRGAIARENGQQPYAAAWFTVAAVLEESLLNYEGIRLREGEELPYAGEQVARALSLNVAAADMLVRSRQPRRALELLEANFTVYDRIPQAERYRKVTAALLPRVLPDPTRLPEPPNIETLACWTAVIAGRAHVLERQYDEATRLFTWATQFEVRKPPTVDIGQTIREPGWLARLGMVDLALKRGNVEAASRELQMLGHPKGLSPGLQEKLDQLRDSVESKGYRSGGQTYHDMLDRQRRQNRNQLDDFEGGRNR